MVTVILTERKSSVLKPSSLTCLSNLPTINLTSGCAHVCLYCYASGYSIHPGKDKVIVYENTLKKVEEELVRKRTKPQAVYFSPSSDIFQPVSEVLEICHSILDFLLTEGIGVAFVTKGQIPEKTMNLLLSYPDKVRAQIGIITLDENIRRTFEPNTANSSTRVAQMRRLVAGGIATEARLIPILPGLTDTLDRINSLLSSIANTGVKRVAVSMLFLRRAIAESLRQGVSNKKVLKDLLGFYTNPWRIAARAERSSIIALPHAIRQEIYARFRQAAKEHGLETAICGCMNPDIACGTCNITGVWPKQFDSQRSLFGGGG